MFAPHGRTVRRYTIEPARENPQKRRADTARVRAEIEELNLRARDEAMDRRAPATVRAYYRVYGRDPRGWPPA